MQWPGKFAVIAEVTWTNAAWAPWKRLLPAAIAGRRTLSGRLPQPLPSWEEIGVLWRLVTRPPSAPPAAPPAAAGSNSPRRRRRLCPP